MTLAELSALDYYDSQTMDVPRTVTALEAWNIITERTGPFMRLAFKVRDAVSAPFGVEPIGGFSGRQKDNVTVGDHLDFFLVERIEPDILVLTVRDSHLDVMTCVTAGQGRVSITASVLTKNRFGRLYMLPVGIAHRRIVQNALRTMKQALSDNR